VKPGDQKLSPMCSLMIVHALSGCRERTEVGAQQGAEDDGTGQEAACVSMRRLRLRSCDPPMGDYHRRGLMRDGNQIG
jgi:hypothetical protein